MDNKIPTENEDKNIINNNMENQTTLDSKTNIIDDDDKKPFFLMTLEDNTGKCQEIKIYQNTNPSELAYNFCKENNLDFSSMKYIKSNIKSIIKRFNEPQQKALIYNNSNNSIKEEEDEDDYLTEGTMRSEKKQKMQEKEEEKFLNESNRNNDVNINKNEDNNNIQENSNNNEEIINISNNSDTNYLNSSNPIGGILNKNNISENIFLKEKNKNLNNDNINITDKINKNIKINDKDKDKDNNNNEIINSHLKTINNIGKIPIKINQISPKQIEINENIQKIINNVNKNSKDNENGNNINSLNSEKISNINKSNYNFLNTTDRSRNSGFDKEVKENTNSIQSREKTDINPNNFVDSPYKLSQTLNDKKEYNKKEYIKEIEKKPSNNFNINDFGENYINLNKKQNNENEYSKSIAQSVDSIESGVPVLNNEIYTDKDENNNNKEIINSKLIINKNEINNNDEVKEEDNNNMNNYENRINKEILINKMKKLEYNLPKKNLKKNKEINKLLYLIKNSCYNINKNIRNKVIKDKTSNPDISDINKLKVKECNSLDINYEISRNLDNESNNFYLKELNNNLNMEKSYKKSNINTNFNSYIENNKFNTKKSNIISTSNNELNPNNTNPISRKYFYSNPNLSSNQDTDSHSNAIFNVKHDFKNIKKIELTSKPKSLGKDKHKNRKSNSRKKIFSKKNNETINNKKKVKNIIKEKAKNASLKFKNRNKNNLTTPSTIEIKNTNFINIKSCQTPPTKKAKNTYHNINTFFSEWLISTISKEGRNGYTTRDHYFNKTKDNNKTSKSVSELANTVGKKSNFRMLLSKSNFKSIKPNFIVKKIKYNSKNKASKEQNKNYKRNNNHYYIHSLKMVNNNEIKNHMNHFNKNFINNNINKNNIIHKKPASRNKALSKKQFDKIKLNNHHVICTINDYNFNNSNSYIKKIINNTFQNFIYDSSENSKSEDKIRKMTTQKQLTSPHKAKYIGIRTKKKSSNKIVEYKYNVNKIHKILLNNSNSNKSYNNNDNGSNININNLININNYQKNKSININYHRNGNNHYVKNSRLKKNKIINKLNNNNNRNTVNNNKRLINFSNELANYYLNTEIFKNNITYSNFGNNNLTLSNYDLSSEEKLAEEILINLFNKIFIFLNKEKTNEINLLDNFYKERMKLFPKNIKKNINNMIEILCKNKGKKINISNNSITNAIKSNENIIKIDKNSFINEMLYIYKYYLTNENRKLLLSNKDEINKIIHDNLLDRSYLKKNKFNNNKNECIYPKSCQKKCQYKTKTETKNNNIRLKSE